MQALAVGDRVEVWERKGQSERFVYSAVITEVHVHLYLVRLTPQSIGWHYYYRDTLRNADNPRRYLKAVTS